MRRETAAPYLPSTPPPELRAMRVVAFASDTYPAPIVPAEVGTVTLALVEPAILVTVPPDTVAEIFAFGMVLDPLVRSVAEMVA